MRRQQKIWFEEYTKHANIPAMNNEEPASGVVMFVELLRERQVATNGTALDIGAGKGRNAIYLAEQGYTVTALEYIEPAIVAGNKLAKKHGVADSVHYLPASIDAPWDFLANYFDVAIDSFASIDIETLEGRRIYRDELLRTLKPGGYAMVMVVSADDTWERDLIKRSPGPEPNSTYWPQNGKFQKDYDEAELRQFYSGFQIHECRKVRKKVVKLGRTGIGTNFGLVLQKPTS